MLLRNLARDFDRVAAGETVQPFVSSPKRCEISRPSFTSCTLGNTVHCVMGQNWLNQASRITVPRKVPAIAIQSDRLLCAAPFKLPLLVQARSPRQPVSPLRSNRPRRRFGISKEPTIVTIAMVLLAGQLAHENFQPLILAFAKAPRTQRCDAFGK